MAKRHHSTIVRGGGTTRHRISFRGAMTKKQWTWTGIITVIIVTVVIFSYGIGVAHWRGWKFPWQAGTPLSPPPPTYTSYNITAIDALTDEVIDEDDIEFNWFQYDVSDIVAEDYATDVEALTFDEFAWEDEDATFTPEEDYIYVLKVNGTDFVTQFLTTEPLLADGNMPTLILGPNPVYVMNETEDISLLAHSTPAYTTTVADTVYTHWTVNLAFLDASEGINAKVTTKEGFKSYYDFEQGEFATLNIEFDTNLTAIVAGVVSMKTICSFERSTSGADVLFAISGQFTGEVSFEFELKSPVGYVLNDDWAMDLIGVDIGFLSAYSAMDTQV